VLSQALLNHSQYFKGIHPLFTFTFETMFDYEFDTPAQNSFNLFRFLHNGSQPFVADDFDLLGGLKFAHFTGQVAPGKATRYLLKK